MFWLRREVQGEAAGQDQGCMKTHVFAVRSGTIKRTQQGSVGLEVLCVVQLQHPGSIISPIWRMQGEWWESWWRKYGDKHAWEGERGVWGRVCTFVLPQVSKATEQWVRSQLMGNKKKNLFSMLLLYPGCVSHSLHSLKHDFGEICRPTGKQRLKLRSLILNTE